MDASFWALVGLVLFFLVLIYFGVPAKIAQALDARAERIRAELEKARGLREEAQSLLANYQRRRQEVEEEAQAILDEAKLEAERLTQETEVALAEMVERRTRALEEKIAQAQAQALSEIRTRTSDLVYETSQQILRARALKGTEAGGPLVPPERQIQELLLKIKASSKSIFSQQSH